MEMPATQVAGIFIIGHALGFSRGHLAARRQIKKPAGFHPPASRQ
jgi:hypothetical protein